MPDLVRCLQQRQQCVGGGTGTSNVVWGEMEQLNVLALTLAPTEAPLEWGSLVQQELGAAVWWQSEMGCSTASSSSCWVFIGMLNLQLEKQKNSCLSLCFERLLASALKESEDFELEMKFSWAQKSCNYYCRINVLFWWVQLLQYLGYLPRN